MRAIGTGLAAAALCMAAVGHGALAQEHSADDIRRAIQEAREDAARARARGEPLGLGRSRSPSFGPQRNVVITQDRVNADGIVRYTPDRPTPAPTQAAASGAAPSSGQIVWAFAEDFRQIEFEYDSVTLTPASIPTVTALADALRGEALAGGRLLLMGHTDASGGADYNLDLSVRRAMALRRALVDRFAVNPDLLVASGAGETDLKTPGAPEAAENRRVEVYVEARI